MKTSFHVPLKSIRQNNWDKEMKINKTEKEQLQLPNIIGMLTLLF